MSTKTRFFYPLSAILFKLAKPEPEAFYTMMYISAHSHLDYTLNTDRAQCTTHNF